MLIADVDLNMCRQVKDTWGFRVSRGKVGTVSRGGRGFPGGMLRVEQVVY